MNRRRQTRRSAAEGGAVGATERPGRPRFFGNELAAAVGLACLAMQLVLVVLLPGDSVAVERGDSLLLVWPSLLAAVFACSLFPRLIGQTHRTVRHALLCWGLFAVWIWIAVAVNATDANLRAAINEAWYWTGVVCSIFAAQFCFRTVQQRRALAAVFMALIAMLVFHAAYQYWVTMPRDVARMAADPEGTLRSVGIDATADPIAAKMFRDRLFSREPIATFALTNSLAGLLLAAITLLFAVLCDVGQVYRQTRMRWLVGGIVLAAVVILFLTKSRTALLLLPIGLLWSAWPMRGAWGGRSMQRHGKWIVLGAASMLVLGAIVGFALFDDLVLRQAQQSLGVRVDYWTASWQMLAARPWVGFGPGNFQSAYYAFRLPTAHEIVADPHNFVFELGTTAGVPAIVLFLLAALLTLKSLFRYRLDADLRSPPESVGDDLLQRTPPRGPTAIDAPPRVFSSMGVRPVLVGAVAGIPLAWLGGLLFGTPPDPEPYFVAIPLGVLVFMALRDWIRHGWLSRFGTMGAFLVLLLHLLASGGITVPGMFVPVVLLLACRLPHAVNPAIEQILAAAEPTRYRRLSRAIVAVPLLLCLLFGLLTWRRVQSAQTAFLRASDLQARANMPGAMASLERAVDSDPFDPRAAMDAGRAWLFAATNQGLPWDGSAERLLEKAIERDRRNPIVYRQAGDVHLQLFNRTQRARHLVSAHDYYRAGLERFPSAIRLRVQLALLLEVLGKQEEASRLAAEALDRMERMTYFGDSAEAAGLIPVRMNGGAPAGREGLPVRETAANLAGDRRVRGSSE